MNSEENLQSIHMHIVHIRYEINIISILTPLMTLFDQVKNSTSNDLINDIFGIVIKFCIRAIFQISAAELRILTGFTLFLHL